MREERKKFWLILVKGSSISTGMPLMFLGSHVSSNQQCTVHCSADHVSKIDKKFKKNGTIWQNYKIYQKLTNFTKFLQSSPNFFKVHQKIEKIKKTETISLNYKIFKKLTNFTKFLRSSPNFSKVHPKIEKIKKTQTISLNYEIFKKLTNFSKFCQSSPNFSKVHQISPKFVKNPN